MNSLFSMINPLNENIRRVVLSGVIREDMASLFLEQITAMEYVDISKPISVYIDTFGGDVSAALLIYDTIKSCCCPIITIGIGKVMSAGTLILAAGEPGSRFITQNTRTMIHEVSGGAIGTMSEMENSIAETRRLQDIYVGILAKETGNSKKKILTDMAKGDLFMSAQETVDYGLADKIVPTRKQMKTALDKTQKAKKAKKGE